MPRRKYQIAEPLELDGVSLSKLILEEREQAEDRLLMATFQQSIAEMMPSDLIPWPDAKKVLGI